ncbi:MmyB family transcriptional regulator [Streptomyces sp. NPDC001759]
MRHFGVSGGGVSNFSTEESRHLHSLAAAARTPTRGPRRHAPEEVPPTTLRLLRTLTSPAMVVGRFLDVLAWNLPAGVLLGEFTRLPHSERNVLGMLLHPETGQACPDRAATVVELTGMLRTQIAADPGHPRAVQLVGELAVRSDEFATLWARHDVEETTRGRIRVDHPLVGELNLDWDTYPIPGAPGRCSSPTPPSREARTTNDSSCWPACWTHPARHRRPPGIRGTGLVAGDSSAECRHPSAGQTAVEAARPATEPLL